MTGNARARNRLQFGGRPGLALVAASVVLPLLLFALVAWYSYRETLREAESRVERTVRILDEHALKVFESQRLVIDEVNLRLRFMDFSREADRVDLHQMLGRLQDDLDQVSTITVIDADGRMLASGRTYPADPKITFTDRDYFRVLKRSDAPLPVVSSSYYGRQSKQVIFNLAGRLGAPGGAFKGVVAVSADRSYFEAFYKSIEPALDHRVLLVRADGAILASEPATPLMQLPPDSILRDQMRKSDKIEGAYSRRSGLDGVERIFAYRKIGPYPVYVRFGISRAAALAPWRSALIVYGIVAVLASLALLVAALLALGQTERERMARRKWQETAAALQAEAAQRERIEGQLRQSQKMEAVGRLTGGLAHDFNNLLTAVIGSLDLVRRRPGDIEPRNLQFIANALEGAQRAAALTSRLLAFSRQQPLEPVTVDANALVSSMLGLLHSTLGEHVAAQAQLAPDLWPTLVDPNQLESAIVNLAVNARDAMPDGGRITITTRNSVASDETAEMAPGDHVLVEVADTGTGMSPDVVAQIFEPFFTTKPVGKGTGLGLSQVYGFVKQSGGHIAVDSRPGRGSVFRLFLPRGAPDAAAPENVPQTGAAVTRTDGETILVVEDEPIVRRLSVAALEDAGYRVLAAGDAAEALGLIGVHRDVALLFTDIVLPGAMDGRRLADAVLADRPGLPVLFTTGYSRSAIVRDGRLDEAVDLIAKPFTSVALVARAQALLDRRRAATRRERETVAP